MKVYFDLRGREWNEKYFTNLNAWRVEKPQAQASDNKSSAISEPAFPKEDSFSESKDSNGPKVEEFDDLPF